MRVLVVNPNATDAITEGCVALARAAAASGTEVVGWTNRESPPVVDSFHADYLAGRALLTGLPRLEPAADAVVPAGLTMPIIEPIACAVASAEMLVRLGLRQSKAGQLAPPPRPGA